jgi:hypothetical protein
MDKETKAAQPKLNFRHREVDPTKLEPHPDNPRIGDVSAIKEAIEANGWHGVVVVDRRTDYTLVGNHRTKAAVELGLKKIPVQYVTTTDDAHATRILLADNKTGDDANYDEDALRALLGELADSAKGLRGTGYDEADREALEAVFEKQQERTNSTQALPASNVKMAQVFLSQEEYEAFKIQIQGLREEYGTENHTDTVLEALRRQVAKIKK